MDLNEQDYIIDMRNIDKGYFLGTEKVPVLKQINFQVKKGEFVAILGPSGSGKTTLMNMITYDILQNIIMPLIVRGMTTEEAQKACMPVIEMLGISHRLKHKPSELSGGQKQRVSIARALVGEPALLLADEPTGALDTSSGKDVLSLFARLHEMGNTIVMITHDLNVAKSAQRIVHIVDGCLS